MVTTKRTLRGALAVAACVYACVSVAVAQTDQNLEQQFARIEQTIEGISRLPEKQRGQTVKKLDRELSAIRKNAVDDSVTHRTLFLQALAQEKISTDALHGSTYKAATSYRKLIAQAGPGALQGRPRGGWPNQYIRRAFERYESLSGAIDGANRKKTVYKMVDVLVKATGSVSNYSYWLAIIILTLVVKMITTPLSHMQFEAMRNMQRIQPKLEKLRRELADDQKEFQRQQWQLMKDHNANPLMGCLPLLVQMPFLLLLYQMIRAYEFQFDKGDFLWIGSTLAERFPFVGASLADPDWPLLLLYGASMYVSTRMSTMDPAQAEQQKMMSIMMPAMFVLIFNYFPSAFILYWFTLNILTTTQQYFMLKKPVPALSLEDEDEEMEPAPAVAAAGGSRGPRPRKRK